MSMYLQLQAFCGENLKRKPPVFRAPNPELKGDVTTITLKAAPTDGTDKALATVASSHGVDVTRTVKHQNGTEKQPHETVMGKTASALALFVRHGATVLTESTEMEPAKA